MRKDTLLEKGKELSREKKGEKYKLRSLTSKQEGRPTKGRGGKAKSILKKQAASRRASSLLALSRRTERPAGDRHVRLQSL